MEGYNDTTHRMLGKSPSEMTREDVEKSVAEKHNRLIHSQEETIKLIQFFLPKPNSCIHIPYRFCISIFLVNLCV